MFNIEYLLVKMQCLYFEKHQMNTLDKSLIFEYIAVMWFYTLLQFVSRCGILYGFGLSLDTCDSNAYVSGAKRSCCYAETAMHVFMGKLCSLVNGHTAIYVLKSLPLETWQFPHSNAYVSHEKHTRSNHACPSSIRSRSNLADILQKTGCEKADQNWLLCVAMENLRLKNAYICTEIRLSAPKITKTRKLQLIFPL